MQLAIAQMQFEVAERQQALLDIRQEKEALQQKVNASRAEYQRVKRYMRRQWPDHNEAGESSDMSSDAYASDGSTSHSTCSPSYQPSSL